MKHLVLLGKVSEQTRGFSRGKVSETYRHGFWPY